MSGRFSEIWLLIGVVFCVQLPAVLAHVYMSLAVTRSQFCQQGWQFHALTGSCMALIRIPYDYIDARNYCELYSGSRITKMEGHLVFIFDKTTDEFVKGLLDEQVLNSAFIGLHDRERNGHYVWGDYIQIPANYTGWADNPHIPDFYKRAVVITKDGWKEYNRGSKAYFVCQASAAKLPDIQCSHQFAETKVRTTCTAAHVYLQIECTWKVNYVNRPITVYDQTVTNVVANTDGFYRATCNASFYVNDVGTYDVTVAMVLALPHSQIEEVKEISVSVAPPQQPPQLYLAGQILQSSLLEVVENQTLTLTCLVPGGDPHVFRTIITCDNIPQSFESDGSSVTMDVCITGAFHGRSCTCSAHHAARYTQTSRVEIRVIYPVKPLSENGGSPAPDLGATVVGVVAAVLVIIIIVLIIFLLRKKGSRRVLEGISEAQAPVDPHYLEIIDLRSDIPASPVHSPNQAIEDPHYLEIIDFQSNIQDNRKHYPNQVLEDPHYLEIIDFQSRI